jgi:hypothetical protein
MLKSPKKITKWGGHHGSAIGSYPLQLVDKAVATSQQRKFAVRAISEGLRMEAGENLRVTIISPGFVRTNFAEGVTNPAVKAQLESARDKFALPSEAIARAIVFAIEQPAELMWARLLFARPRRVSPRCEPHGHWTALPEGSERMIYPRSLSSRRISG